MEFHAVKKVVCVFLFDFLPYGVKFSKKVLTWIYKKTLSKGRIEPKLFLFKTPEIQKQNS